jgi:hypothetical protein
MEASVAFMIHRECCIRFYEILRVHHLPIQERVVFEPFFKAFPYFIPPFDALLILHERFYVLLKFIKLLMLMLPKPSC